MTNTLGKNTEVVNETVFVNDECRSDEAISWCQWKTKAATMDGERLFVELRSNFTDLLGVDTQARMVQLLNAEDDTARALNAMMIDLIYYFNLLDVAVTNDGRLWPNAGKNIIDAIMGEMKLLKRLDLLGGFREVLDGYAKTVLRQALKSNEVGETVEAKLARELMLAGIISDIRGDGYSGERVGLGQGVPTR